VIERNTPWIIWKQFCHKNHKIYKKTAKKKVARRFEIKILFNTNETLLFY